jgi:hypothetical protein
LDIMCPNIAPTPLPKPVIKKYAVVLESQLVARLNPCHKNPLKKISCETLNNANIRLYNFGPLHTSKTSITPYTKQRMVPRRVETKNLAEIQHTGTGLFYRTGTGKL